MEVLDGVGQGPDTATQSGWRVSYRISRPEALAQAADCTAAVKNRNRKNKKHYLSALVVIVVQFCVQWVPRSCATAGAALPARPMSGVETPLAVFLRFAGQPEKVCFESI
ncbi:UNVERIFIED_ORG: hypothetical protein HNP28_000444 [Comamonas terrigena]